MSFLENIFKKGSVIDNRKARRLDSPPLVAYYFDGGTPTAHEIQNISSDGFYLLTPDRLRPGTVITMTLQMPSEAKETSSSRPHLTVTSLVVRQGEDGVGFVFIPNEPKDSKDSDHSQESPSRPASKKAIARFIEQIKSNGGHMMIPFREGIPKQPPAPPDTDAAKPKTNPRRKFADESGQALVMSALAMTCLLGFCALAADVGIMLREKRLLQTAADSAAIAGALQINVAPANVSAAAKLASTQNGFTDGSNGATVTVNGPPGGPLYGAHASNPNAVEVIISQSQPTLFMGLFGFLSMSPTARAVAVNGGASNGCVFITNPTASPSFNLQGSFDVTTPNCGIYVNSNAAGALNFTGAGGTLTAGSIGVAGTCTGHCTDATPAPVQGMVAVSDPLAKLDPSFPDPTKMTCTPGGALTGTVAAGCYSGDASGNLTVTNGTFDGMFVFTGAGTLTLSGTTATNTTDGATIDLVNGSLTESTNTTIAWNASTSGTFKLIAIMAPPTNTTGTLNFSIGDATGSLTGIIYAPNMAMTMQDHGGSGKKGGLSLTTDLIVGTLFDTSALLNLTSLTQTIPGSPLTRVTLVE